VRKSGKSQVVNQLLENDEMEEINKEKTQVVFEQQANIILVRRICSLLNR
jgi:hypothetical protein